MFLIASYFHRAEAMENILAVNHLTTQFLSKGVSDKAVDDLSFDLTKGETLGIVGESGSGKSVTALSIMRLILQPPGKIAGGEIFYQQLDKNIDLLNLSEKEMRSYRGKEIAMIFQEPMTSLNPVLTCGFQVAEAIVLHKKVSNKEAKQQTIKLFEKVQLPNTEQIFDAYPHQLSGGQKQRVMIAMAISCDPKILIADEPTTALDVTIQQEILKLLKSLQQETGMSIIFITHDLGVIAEVAERVIVMYKGKKVEEAAVADIFKNPQHPYTKGLLACRPSFNTHLKQLPTVDDFMQTNADGSVQSKAETIEQVLQRFEEKSGDKKMVDNIPLLKVENLSTHFSENKNLFSKHHETVKAVDDVSFEVYCGETLGLVGESGCGKTTLGKTILRLIEPTSGKIVYDDQVLNTFDENAMREMRKRMQIIFQDPYSSLNPRITIGKAIMEPMQVHRIHANDKIRKEKAMELLQKVNLQTTYFDRYPHEFSGGQRQRICIARALAVNPEFIICDECVSALDVSVQAQVLNLLNSLKNELGFTTIFISHDLSVVKFMSDRIIVMKNGKIEEVGTADEIYNHPKSAYTQKLIASIPKTIF